MLALALVGLLFGVNDLAHPFMLLFYVILISALFGLIGIIVGVWADNSFEKFGIATNFIITPLSFLGGAFYSVTMLPTSMQFLVYLNPIFYAVDGLRYSLTGYHEASLLTGASVLVGLTLLSLYIVVRIFRTGWKLRT